MFSLYLVSEACFITSILYCIIFSEDQVHTHVLCVQVLFDWAVSVFDSHFHIPQYYHMPREATIFLSASPFDPHYTKMKQKEGLQTDH